MSLRPTCALWSVDSTLLVVVGDTGVDRAAFRRRYGHHMSQKQVAALLGAEDSLQTVMEFLLMSGVSESCVWPVHALCLGCGADVVYCAATSLSVPWVIS